MCRGGPVSKVSKQTADNSSKVVSIAQSKPIKTLPEVILNQKEIFRQKRIDNSKGQLQLKVGNDSYKLINWSRTGIAFEIPKSGSTFPVGLKVGPTKVFVGTILVYEGDIEIMSIRENDDGSRFVGAAFKSTLFLVEGIEAALHVNETIFGIENLDAEITDIDPKVTKVILKMASALQILQKSCRDQEERLSRMTFDERSEALKIFLPSMSAEIKKIFDKHAEEIETLVDIEKLEKNSIFHRLFQSHLFPYLQGADLSRRAFEKPRGYDGDFEMMNQVYRQDFEGADLMGKVIHHYAINVETNAAVQFRRPYFLSHMESALDLPGNKNFLSLASGPAWEVQDVVTRWPQKNLDRVVFHLFDLDRAALEHSQTKIFEIAIEKSKSPNIEFVNASVKALLNHHEESAHLFDLIYSGGLFDYLDNLTSKVIVQNLVKMLRPNGRVVIGNLTKDVRTKGFISLLLNWQLIYKTEADMREWVNGVPNCKVSVDYDPNRINAFIVIEKKG